MSPALLSAPARGGKYTFRRRIGGTSFFKFGCVTSKFSTELDQVTLYTLQLLLDLGVSIIHCLDPSTA